MRCCSARIFTFFTLAILSAQSFTFVHAQSSSGAAPSSPAATSTPIVLSTPSLTPPSASSSAVSSPTQSAPAVSQSPTASASSSDSQTASSVQSQSSSQDVVPSSATSSSVSSAVASSSTPVPSSSSSPSSTSLSSSSVVLSSSSSVPLTSTSQTSSSVPATSSAQSTVYTTSIAPPVPYAPLESTSSSYFPATQGIAAGSSGQGISTVSGVVGADATGTTSASSKSFFDNKSAVAGVFTVVALIGAGTVLAIVLRIVRRRNRHRYDEDNTFFTKDLSSGGNFGDSGNVADDNASMTEVVAHAAPDAYPDRASHYGMPAFTDDTQPRDSIVEYAKGTAYAAARAQAGPYQYSAQAGAYGGEFTNAHYQAPATALPDAFPAADPYSIARSGGAPAAYAAGAGQQYNHPYTGYAGNDGDVYLVNPH